MKKLLAIIVLGLFWCNAGFAELIELNKCFTKKPGGVMADVVIWNSWNEFNKDVIKEYYNCTTCKKIKIDDDWHTSVTIYEGPKYEDVIYSVNTENMIVTQLSIFDDNWLDAMLKYNIQFKENDPKEWKELFNRLKKYGMRLTLKPEKHEYVEYKIINYAAGIVLAERISPSGSIETLNINLKKNQVDSNWNADGEAEFQEFFEQHSQFFCNKQESIATNIASGTAFFINNKGNLLTNNHVVDGCIQSKINYLNKEYDAQILATDKTLDLALLKVNLVPKSYLSFSGSMPKKLQKIYVAGYPFGKGLSDDLKITDGIISSLKGVEDNSNELQVSAPINHGNSGGPIVGQKGELVGIAVSGLAKEISEGINFGIKSSAAANFLSVNEIQPSVSNNRPIDDDKLLKILEESTVYTYCEIK